VATVNGASPPGGVRTTACVENYDEGMAMTAPGGRSLEPPAFFMFELHNRRERERALMVVKGEGLIRLEAERLLLRRFRSEYDEFRAGSDHIEAVKALVVLRKREYDACVREARASLFGDQAAA